MSNTRVLFVGGTGLISSACVREAVRQGMEVTLLNRGSAGTRSVPSNVEILHADVRSKASVRAALGERTFDVIAQFVGFTREHVETDIELFTGAADSTCSSVPPRRTKLHRAAFPSANRRPSGTDSGSTHRTRSNVKPRSWRLGGRRGSR